MVTCTRQAPAHIELRLMAPINSNVVAATTTTATTSIDIKTVRPKLAFTIDALVGAQSQPRVPLYTLCTPPHKSPTPSTIDSDCDVVGDASPTASSPAPTQTQSSSAKQSQLRRPLPLPATNTLPQTSGTPILPHMLTPTALNFSPAHLPPRLHMGTGPPTSHAAIPTHVLSAQFHQMAAALAQQQQHQQQHHLHMPAGHPMTIFPNQQHMLTGAPFVRDSYPLYPWFLTRHGRVFPHRFPGNFLLQPFRKPKRVRTAFSPTQLLKLEHAFEGNHYVVGAERKQLAQALSLSETQVKVWFQNRRTKHKRMQQEGGDSDTRSNKGSQADGNEGKNDSTQDSFEDYQNGAEDFEDRVDGDEMIDMNDYETSDINVQEQERNMREQFRQQIHEHQQRLLQEEKEHFSQLNKLDFRQQQQQQQQQQ